MNMQLTIGEVLMIARKRRGLSTREVAEELGVSHQTIYNLERDKPVMWTTLTAAAELLGLRITIST